MISVLILFKSKTFDIKVSQNTTFSIDKVLQKNFLMDYKNSKVKYDLIIFINEFKFFNLESLDWAFVINSCLNLFGKIDQHAIISPIINYYQTKLLEEIDMEYTYSEFYQEDFFIVRKSVFYNFFFERWRNHQKILTIYQSINQYGFVNLLNLKLILQFKIKYRLPLINGGGIASLLQKSLFLERIDIGIELSYISPSYNGTTEYSLSILPGLIENLTIRKINFKFIISKEIVTKFNLQMYDKYIIDPIIKHQFFFNTLFLPHQVYTYDVLRNLTKNCFKYIITYLDVIALRSPYLNHSRRLDLISYPAVKFSSKILSISKSSARDIEEYYREKQVKIQVEPILITSDPFPFNPNESKNYLLIMGNSYKHKAIEITLENLKNISIPVKVFGDKKLENKFSGNFQFFQSGLVSESKIDELYSSASLILYPSVYEGFGLPILKAIHLGKTVIAYNSKVNLELKEKYDLNNQIILFKKFSHLEKILLENYNISSKLMSQKITRSWEEVGKEIGIEIQKVYDGKVDFNKLQERLIDFEYLERLGIDYSNKISMKKFFKIILMRIKPSIKNRFSKIIIKS